MDSVLQWGLGIVRAVQVFFGPALLAPMKVISFFGSEMFALAALPFVYWCMDRKKGARLGLVVLVSAFTNMYFKVLFKQPRPYDLDSSVGLTRESSFGLPSGHAQSSLTFWGLMLMILPRALGIVLIIVLPLLVALSRLYLGVHFPSDIAGGWLLGGAILGLYYGFGARIEALLKGWRTQFRVMAVAAAALAMNALLPTDTRLAGAFFGSGLGFVLAAKNLRFSAKGSAAAKALRYLLGIAGTAALYIGPKLLLGEAFAPQAMLILFLRYGLVGFWVAYGAPFCFLKLKLAGLEETHSLNT